ncbi:hypothetical protein PTSG_07025 [Salpingoeca rosetta]|uniref:Major facilitator superfamily (MFS) profile domain-containing protein n=1 Tax=Salpingoeca rosetta (strain ATCC 50818 / BSB-021) TaxID=946362 RepID=F2UDU2_SALR5|nr:uncharacterized protein PTSG_07025 [Salpingoeca rosetta]EGD74792.1 hypothetical protein PTSG_07025 [Salpingoeca rosetta]|eukprot:XP_004992437.1 hypothetical protein PTSG_07025 [Salpingoeca rosetta]
MGKDEDDRAMESPLLTSESGSSKFKLYKSRWLMLTLVSLLQISNAMIWIGFAPIISIAREYFNTNTTMIDFQSIIFMIVSIPFGFAGTWCLNTLGLRKSLVLASWLNGIGGIVRWVGVFLPSPHAKLALVTVGQGIAACSQPIFLDSPTLLAATWFGEHERAEANMIASVANPVGIAVGSLLSGLLVSEAGDIKWMLLINAALSLVISLLVTVLFKDRPPTPPSHSAEEAHLSFVDGLKQLIRIPAYWALLVGFGIGIGLVSSLSSLFGQFTEAYGYSSDDAGYMSMAMVVAGLVGAGLSGYLLDKTGAFLVIFKVCYLGATGGVVLFMFMNKADNLAWLIVACAVTGFFAFAALPVGLELSVECTFPVHEGLSAGLIWIFAQATSIVIIFSSNALRGEARYFNGTHPIPQPPPPGPTPDPDIHTYYEYPHAIQLCVGFTAVATLITLFLRTEYKRKNSEAAYNDAHKQAAVQQKE